MIKQFKNTIWAFALKILGMYGAVVLINVLVFLSLSSMFNSNSVWQWFLTSFVTIMVYLLIWLTCASRGKGDVDIDALNKKRLEINPNAVFSSQYVPYNGFLAGLIAMIPALILIIIKAITNNGIVDIILRLVFSMQSKPIELWGSSPLAPLMYLFLAALFILVCGLAYMTGPNQKAKILTIIKRNEAKLKMKKRR